MKSKRSARPAMPPSRYDRAMSQREAKTWATLLSGSVLALMLSALLASCSSLGKPELQRSNQAPSCNQRGPAVDSGDPPESTDWMAWAAAYVVAQYAVADRDNKRAATADCLDQLARIKP